MKIMKSERCEGISVRVIGLFVLLATTSSSAALAQSARENLSSYLELGEADIRAKTMEIIKGSMNFTEEEGKSFWPIFGKYEYESGTLTDQMIALIKEYKANVKALSNEKANELAQKVFELDEQKVRLNKKYYGEFCKVLPATRVMQFFQLSRRIDTLLSMRIASILPMIGEDW
jgi:hypothetical protein